MPPCSCPLTLGGIEASHVPIYRKEKGGLEKLGNLQVTELDFIRLDIRPCLLPESMFLVS